MVICAETAFTAYSAFIIPVFHQKNKVYFMNTQSLRRNASAALFALGAEQQSSWLLAPLFAAGSPRGLVRVVRRRSDRLDCVNNSLCKRAG